MRRRTVAVAAPVVLFLLLAVAWQLAAAALGPLALPTLGRVAVALVSDPSLLPACVETFGSALAGLGVAALVAMLLAALAVAVPVVRAAVVPVSLAVSVTPIVAIAPALYFVLGPAALTTPLAHVVLAALTSFFPLLIGAIRGMTAIDPEAEAVFRVLAASRWETFLRLRLPSSTRSVLTGLRLAATLAVIGAIVAELSVGNAGLGYLIGYDSSNSLTAALWAAVALSAAGTLVLVGVIALVERRVVRW